jgi:hypothetical protein
MDAKDVNIILVQVETKRWLPFLPFRGFSLHVMIGTYVAVRGELVESRVGALAGLRNAVEKLAYE